MRVQATAHGFTQHPLHDATLDELAAHTWMRPRLSPGVGFARMLHGRGEPNGAKDAGRGAVISYVHAKAWPWPLKMLTMPGLRWPFEKHLIKARGADRWSGLAPEARTTFVCVENDPVIWRAALARIPGLEPPGSTALVLDPRSIRTPTIHRYTLGDVEDELFHGEEFNAAWCDWTGPLTERRMYALRAFWRQDFCHLLAFTVLNARQSGSARAELARYGGVIAWAGHALGGGYTCSTLEYTGPNGVPITQVIRRKAWPA